MLSLFALENGAHLSIIDVHFEVTHNLSYPITGYHLAVVGDDKSAGQIHFSGEVKTIGYSNIVHTVPGEGKFQWADAQWTRALGFSNEEYSSSDFLTAERIRIL